MIREVFAVNNNCERFRSGGEQSVDEAAVLDVMLGHVC